MRMISRRWRALAVLAMAVATGAAECRRPASTPAVRAALGEEVTLAPRQEASVEGLTVQFLRVTEDSRCPAGVTCVQAGQARVELMLTLRDRAENAILTTNGEPRSARLGPYAVHLVRVVPIPTRDGVPRAEDYRVTLRIEKP